MDFYLTTGVRAFPCFHARSPECVVWTAWLWQNCVFNFGICWNLSCVNPWRLDWLAFCARGKLLNHAKSSLFNWKVTEATLKTVRDRSMNRLQSSCKLLSHIFVHLICTNSFCFKFTLAKPRSILNIDNLILGKNTWISSAGNFTPVQEK